MVDLINKKWERFASRIFFQRFLFISLYLFVFTCTTILHQTVRPAAAADDSTAGDGGSSAVVQFEYPKLLMLGELIVMLGALYKGRRELKEMVGMGVVGYFSVSGSAFLENVISSGFCLMIVLRAALGLIDSDKADAALALAGLIGWSYLLFFLLAFRLTGPFVVMIHKMLFGDVLRFVLIFFVFLGGFSQAFFVLLDERGFSGYLESVKACFMAMLGDFDLEQYTASPQKTISVSLLICYVVVVTILLLNLLIAMMGDTYGNVNEEADKQWHTERARIVFAIENEMSDDERNEERNRYWITSNNERFLQVEAVNPDHFRKKAEDEGEGKKKND